MNAMVNTNINRRSSCSNHLNKDVKGLWRLKLSTNTRKIKAANEINTSDDVRNKLVRSFQKKKEDGNFKSVFKDAKRYAEELQLDYKFNENEARVITHADQVAVISTKGPLKIKEILRKTNKDKIRTEVMEQPWELCLIS